MKLPWIQIRLASVMVCALVVLSCGGPRRREVKQARGLKQELGTAAPEKLDTFCDSPARSQEILFKLNQCSEDLDVDSLGKRLTTFLNERTKKADVITVTRVASNCYFLARSSTRSVPELMDTFKVFAPQSNLDKSAKHEVNAISIVQFEPNFLIRLNNEIDPLNSPASPHNTAADWWFGNPPGSDGAIAWTNYGNGLSDVVVGILDTGIDYNHPELAPNI